MKIFGRPILWRFPSLGVISVDVFSLFPKAIFVLYCFFAPIPEQTEKPSFYSQFRLRQDRMNSYYTYDDGTQFRS